MQTSHMQTSQRHAPKEVVLDLEHDDEVNYLAKKYGVTPARVREVAREVGPTYAAVEEGLSRSDPHCPE
jgi:Protein of unknown function (DUF3606)